MQLHSALLAAAFGGAFITAAHAEPEAVTRGRYLAQAGDCAACHTTPGGADYAGGLPINTPFGKLIPSNITPDRETGIGGWTTAQFINAVKRGIGVNGEHLYAAMPFNDYVKVSDADISDIKAYLDTVVPVNRKVVSNQLPFPFNIRLSLIAWNLLYFDDTPFKPDPARNAEWNRGAYLVQGLGHCAACHSPKTLLGGDRSGKYLQGSPVEGWWAPPLTSEPETGLADWTIDDIKFYLGTGTNRHAVAGGPMAEAVTDSTQYLTNADLQAIAVYLKSLPAGPASEAKAAPDGAHRAAGAAIFADNCAGCHAADGSGVDGMVPALRSDPTILANSSANLLHVVLAGGKVATTHGNPTAAGMPAFAWKLTDAEIADVAGYVRNSWGHHAGTVSADAVASVRKTLGAGPALTPAGK